jgi:hypothetical protein
MPLPAAVAALIETFRNNEADYLRPDFKEARLRQQFLDLLFTALGWDINNIAGYSETYKEVVLEDAIHTNSETKSADLNEAATSLRVSRSFDTSCLPSINSLQMAMLYGFSMTISSALTSKKSSINPAKMSLFSSLAKTFLNPKSLVGKIRSN